MNTATLGERAPALRLPSGHGREIALDDYRGRNKAIVWFTKGMACAFCRQQMSQLARGYPQFRAQGAEILEITLSTPDRARFYVDKFKIPFPYLCDPEYTARRAWGLEARSHSMAWYAKTLYTGFKSQEPPSDFGAVKTPLTDLPRLIVDDDMGFFIVDRDGVVRYALTGSYVGDAGVRQIPGNDEIMRELERCEQVAAG
ncbi:MAG: AhpC/TSA family protein [Candidatus Rokubacteria bacterium]|nr:AhpC/TSA family protein [Candidatus Rokubacteria bacterium]